MGRLLLVSSILTVLPVAAWSADLPTKAPPPASSLWTGTYFGLNAGYNWGDNSTSFTFFPEAFGPFGFPASATVNNSGFIGGAQWGYNYQLGSFVFGTESDFDWLRNSGTITGLNSITPGTLTLTDKVEWLSTFRARLGFTPTDRILLYGTGGLAAGEVSASTNVTFPAVSYLGSNTDTLVGWALGAGAEYAITNNLFARIEYLHYDLGTARVVGYPNNIGAAGFLTQTQFDVAGNVVRAGLDYKFDLLGWLLPAAAAPAPGMVTKAPPIREFEVEAGARYWYSSGKTEKDLFNLGGAGQLSRLTYNDLTANSGESFFRADHSSGLFAKGNIGLGAVSGGNLKDEDLPPFEVPYSATMSDQKDGSLTYGTVDVGYSFLRAPGYRLGVFGGYNYYREQVNAVGCTQVATNPGVCVPGISDASLVITNDNTWNSARIGLNGDVMLSDRIKLSVDAAWLPYMQLNGSDTHWLRISNFPIAGAFGGPIPQDGTGHSGAQIEGILSYQVLPGFSLGVGGRYWYFEESGNSLESFPGAGSLSLPTNFKTERYGGFVQGAFKF